MREQLGLTRLRFTDDQCRRQVQRPLATVVIGGLVTSTVLTLLVLPSLYVWWFDQGQPRVA